VDELWEKLSEGGEKQRCGWLKDKYGVSWQIVSLGLGKMLRDKIREGHKGHAGNDANEQNRHKRLKQAYDQG